MKKKLIIGSVLILLLSLVLHSCKDLSYSGAMSINYNNISVVDYESALILDLLNNSKWTNSITSEDAWIPYAANIEWSHPQNSVRFRCVYSPYLK